MFAAFTSVVNVALEAIYLILPEITMFACALLGTVLFSGRLGHQLIDHVLVVYFGFGPAVGTESTGTGSQGSGPGTAKPKKIVDDEMNEETSEQAQEEQDQAEEALAIITMALRKPDGIGLNDALEQLHELPESTQVPSEMATKLLSLAGFAERLPAAVALLMDVKVDWLSNALEAPMAEASARSDVELCLQLHRAAENLGIPKHPAACVSLLNCLEENTKETPSMTLRVIAEDIVQDPFLDIDESLALALLRAGISPDDEKTSARILGRPSS